jgi:hypothetical protein
MSRVGEEVLLKDSLGRRRDARQGPGGYISIAIDGGLQGNPNACREAGAKRMSGMCLSPEESSHR